MLLHAGLGRDSVGSIKVLLCRSALAGVWTCWAGGRQGGLVSVLLVVVTQQQCQGVLRLLGTACFPLGLPGAEPSAAHTAGVKATATPLATHHPSAIAAAPSPRSHYPPCHAVGRPWDGAAPVPQR